MYFDVFKLFQFRIIFQGSKLTSLFLLKSRANAEVTSQTTIIYILLLDWMLSG